MRRTYGGNGFCHAFRSVSLFYTSLSLMVLFLNLYYRFVIRYLGQLCQTSAPHGFPKEDTSPNTPWRNLVCVTMMSSLGGCFFLLPLNKVDQELYLLLDELEWCYLSSQNYRLEILLILLFFPQSMEMVSRWV